MKLKDWWGALLMSAAMAATATILAFESIQSNGVVQFLSFYKKVLVGAAVITTAMFLWLAVVVLATWLFGKLNVRCWFGHRKKWLAVYLFCSSPCRGECPAKDSHGGNWYDSKNHWDTVQIGRWVCERPGCLAMDEKCFGDASRKRYTIEFGRLVKDEKVWANPHAQTEVKS